MTIIFLAIGILNLAHGLFCGSPANLVVASMCFLASVDPSAGE